MSLLETVIDVPQRLHGKVVVVGLTVDATCGEGGGGDSTSGLDDASNERRGISNIPPQLGHFAFFPA